MSSDTKWKLCLTGVMKLNLRRRVIFNILDELWQILWSWHCQHTFFLWYNECTVQHCELIHGANMLQAKDSGGKEKLTGFFHGFLVLKNSLSVHPHPLPTMKIFTYVLRHLKVFPMKQRCQTPCWLCVVNPTKDTGWTRKRRHCLSYDAFLNSDLFWRWLGDTSSPSWIGTTWGPGSGGYCPAWRYCLDQLSRSWSLVSACTNMRVTFKADKVGS